MQGCWKVGGFGEDAPWPCVFKVLGFVAYGGRLMRLLKEWGALSPGRGGGLAASSPATKRMLAGLAVVQRSRLKVLCVLGLVAVVLGVFFLVSSACVCSFFVSVLIAR